MINDETVILDGNSLTLEQFDRVSQGLAQVQLDQKSLERVAKIARQTEEIAHKDPGPVYGLNTGLGPFAQVRLSNDVLETFSGNVILSHAAGVGHPFDRITVRGAMCIQLNMFLKGASGVRPEILHTLQLALNKDLIPFIPQQGSLGASGDLAPLAHMWLVLSRREEPVGSNSGQAWYGGHLLSGEAAAEAAGLDRPVLKAKEGLSVVNGTHFMSSILATLVLKARLIVQIADIVATSTSEALCTRSAAFHPVVHALRPHPGQLQSANNCRNLMLGSTLIDSLPELVQDAYAIRCLCQVHGAARDVLEYANSVATVELNSVTDSPVADTTGAELKFLSGGNFHGEPLGYAADSLCIALTGLSNISDRRTFRMMDHILNRGAPDFLVQDGGLNSGLMITTYTASALVSENKSHCFPASVDSIPSSRNQEDHVSMGTIAARKALGVLKNTEYVLAIEMLVACQLLDFRRSMSPGAELGKGTHSAYNHIRNIVPFLSSDRVQSDDIEAVRRALFEGDFISVVERNVGVPIA